MRARVDVPIAADESIRRAEDPLRVARAEAADIACSRCSRSAGCAACLRHRRADRAARGRVVGAGDVGRHRRRRGPGRGAARAAVRLRAGHGRSCSSGDVVAEPLLPVDGSLPVRRPAPDPALLAAAGRTRRRGRGWSGRIAAVHGTAREPVDRAGDRAGRRAGPRAACARPCSPRARARRRSRSRCTRPTPTVGCGCTSASTSGRPASSPSGWPRRPGGRCRWSRRPARPRPTCTPPCSRRPRPASRCCVLTADRPPELRGVGANQTIDQVKLYGDAVRLFHEVGAPDAGPGRTPTGAAWSAAPSPPPRGTEATPGRCTSTWRFREPLVPEPAAEAWPESLDGRAGRRARGPVSRTRRPPAPERDGAGRRRAARSSATSPPGWVRQPSSPRSPSAGRSSLSRAATPDEDRTPCRLGHLLVGRPDLKPRSICVVGPADADAWRPLAAAGSRGERSRRLPRPVAGPTPPVLRPPSRPRLPYKLGHEQPDTRFLERWKRGRRRGGGRRGPDGVVGRVHRVGAVLPRCPQNSCSSPVRRLPVRDLQYAAPRDGVTVIANRGRPGIDGTVSTAMGAALAWQVDGGGPAYALLGDLTFLHDANGLILGPQEPLPRLTIVVVNNDGGGIFAGLEPGRPEHARAFERVFGTPTGDRPRCALRGDVHALHARDVARRPRRRGTGPTDRRPGRRGLRRPALTTRVVVPQPACGWVNHHLGV